MTKDQRNIVVEYSSMLSEDDLRWLGLRMAERLSGDMPETLNFMSRNSRVDSILQSTNTSWELYDLYDKIREIVVKECKRKGVALKWGPQPS